MVSDGGGVRVLWDTADWAAALAALEPSGLLGTRTAIVPNMRVAFALRREFAQTQPRLLAGTRFVSAAPMAVEVLRASGIMVSPAEDDLRIARTRALLAGSAIPFAYLDVDLMRATPGWAEALAATIADLEAAGLRPEQLDASNARFSDLRTIWQLLDESAASSWSRARVLSECTRRLAANPELWPFDGPVLAVIAGTETRVEAEWMRALPNATLAIIAARPRRERFVARQRELFGPAVAHAFAASVPPVQHASERDLLAGFLFEEPERLAAADRPVSNGPDGTVHFEHHAGVEAEVEAAANWVARQVLEYGTPLDEIAILSAHADPYAGLIAERIARLEWPIAVAPVLVAAGVPLSATAGGARTLAFVRALRRHLPIDAFAEVLPQLRWDGEGTHIRRDAALAVATSLGTIGGNAAHPDAALSWAKRLRERAAELQAHIDRVDALTAQGVVTSDARRIEFDRSTIANLRALQPAVDAVNTVARAAIEGRPLAEVWACFFEVVSGHLIEPRTGARAIDAIRPAMDLLCAEEGCAAVAGMAALELIEETLTSARIPLGRVGDPSVYVGTVAGAVGVSFTAVRIVGVAEGAIPSVPREDPVLPDSMRRALSAALPTATERAQWQLMALDRVVRGATREVVLSAPRQGVEGSQREPSAVFIEAAAALGRPNTETGERAAIPDGMALRRDGFAPARAVAVRFRLDNPMSQAAWHSRLANGQGVIPAHWMARPAVDLTLMHGCHDDLGAGRAPAALGYAARGLTSDRATSASRLKTLLQCPHRYLLENVLYWKEAATAEALGELDPATFGSLVHEVAEQFARAHGASFGRREKSLPEWQALAAAMTHQCFGSLARQFPFASASAAAQQRTRALETVAIFLEYDWDDGRPRRLVAAEQPFGYPNPLPLKAGQRELFLHGFIDRIDVDGDTTLVRDLKTGKPTHRFSGGAPDARIDLQLGIYVAALRAHTTEWGTTNDIAAVYAHTVGYVHQERAYIDDVGALEQATATWLDVAGQLLAEGEFPRSPDINDCTYCQFSVACGTSVGGRVDRALDGATGAAAAFRDLKRKGLK